MSLEPRANLLFKEVVCIAPDGQRFGKDIARKKTMAGGFRCRRATNTGLGRFPSFTNVCRGYSSHRNLPCFSVRKQAVEAVHLMLADFSQHRTAHNRPDGMHSVA